MISMQDIIEMARATAIADALHTSEEANYRYICRYYSKTFHTPLHEVYLLDAEEVVRAFFEDQMDSRDVEKELDSLMDMIYELEDPNYDAAKRGELTDFIKEAEEEERRRIAANKPIHPALARENEVSLKNASQEAPQPDPEMPTGGSLNLSYLADSSDEG